jgi:hypothetical protein
MSHRARRNNGALEALQGDLPSKNALSRVAPARE